MKSWEIKKKKRPVSATLPSPLRDFGEKEERHMKNAFSASEVSIVISLPRDPPITLSVKQRG